jgi:hypothetical protein
MNGSYLKFGLLISLVNTFELCFFSTYDGIEVGETLDGKLFACHIIWHVQM